MDDSLFDGLFEDFDLEAREQLDRIEARAIDLEALAGPAREACLVEIRRDLHTIKGNSGIMGLVDLQAEAHRLEDLVDLLTPGDSVAALLGGVDVLRRGLERVRQGHRGGRDAVEVEEAASSIDEGGIRVSFGALDALFDRVSEMVIFRNRLSDAIARGARDAHAGRAAWREVEEAHQTLAATLLDLQAGVTALRMVPLGKLFPGWRRIVHDEASRRGVRVELRTVGGETPIDKALLEAASETVGHLVRNAVVHGAQSAEVRAAAGKPAVGQLVVAAAAHGDEVHIDVEDDGAGIDLEALERRAQELGVAVPSELDRPSLVFLPGLSTAAQTDQSAGRGIGLAAVVESIRRRGGSIEVHTERGVGTRFRLRLPLTASIIRAMLVAADGEQYAVPMMLVHETLLLTADRRSMIGTRFVDWRGERLPLLDLGVALGTAVTPRQQGRVVVVEARGRRRALAVDAVVGLLDVVVRSLDEVLAEPTGVAGCTILGDGTVVVIVDPAALEHGRVTEARSA